VCWEETASCFPNLVECGRLLPEAPLVLFSPRRQAQASYSEDRLLCVGSQRKADCSCANMAGGAVCSLARQFSPQADVFHHDNMAFLCSFLPPFALQSATIHAQTSHAVKHPQETRHELLAIFQACSGEETAQI
jgi:hypothetical protein